MLNLKLLSHILLQYVRFCMSNMARCQSWLIALGTNMDICPQISILAPNSTSGICAVVTNIICQSTMTDSVYKYAEHRISFKLNISKYWNKV